MREYKVVSVKERSFLQQALNAEKLEKVINEYASQGWIYHNAITNETQLLGKDVFLLVFYRER